ncbi:MAG: type II toxin-antitoxin system VapC family toxin [Ktedonobacterales bacterium]
MPAYFLDTSAVVKRQIAEPGHTWVRALCSPDAGNSIAIAEITLVEVPATFSRMARETPKRIRVARRDRLIADFEDRVRRQYEVVRITRNIYTQAAGLCRVHPLRAYDAVQLACALTRRDDDLASGSPAPTFVCADAALLAAAAAEGLGTENPNTHP